MRRRLLLCSIVLGVAACVPRLPDPENRPCPCADGFKCCPSDNRCVLEEDSCPADEIVISGTVCTSTAEELLYPVKIVLVIDTSASMQFTDPSAKNIMAAREASARALVAHFNSNPAVSFAIVRFSSTVTVNDSTVTVGGGPIGSSVFTRDPTVLEPALSGLSLADLQTDYEGALTTTVALLKHDIEQSSAVERARTRYVVMFLSDGGPSPQCQDGCDNDKVNLGGSSLTSWCDLPRDQWCDTYGTTGPQCKSMEQWFPYLTIPCQEYNTEPRTLKLVTEIMGLKDKLGIGGITFNTTFLEDPALPPAIQELFGVKPSSNAPCSKDPDCTVPGETCVASAPEPPATAKTCKGPSERLLVEMARLGKGTYRRFSGGKQIDFLLFDYASLFRPFGMTTLIVTNTNTRLDKTGTLADSDGDGLADGLELTTGFEVGSPDSDGDGYSDLVERMLKSDPLKASRLEEPCASVDRVDTDGDGLNNCEERALGTDPRVMDSDRDRIPDGLELSFGTNPLAIDDKDDLDFDGKANGVEIAAHTDPKVSDADLASHGYRYTIRQLPGQKKCFEFSVAGVRTARLAKTLGQGSDTNRILVVFGEAPTDVPQDYGNFKVARVCAKLGNKTPAPLVPTDFMPATMSKGGCGQSPCARLCEQQRENLIKNLGVQPGQLNCADLKWDVDCATCYELFKRELEVVAGKGSCEALL